MTDNGKFFTDYRKRVLDPISPTICAAKWYNATIWLYMGQTASCHHAEVHPANLAALSRDPSYLHNTDEKKLSRKQMLAGERPRECNYCWTVEDLREGERHVSDRFYKTSCYSDDEIRSLPKHDVEKNVNPKTLEIAFDRTCNLACSYCSYMFSTAWVKDITKNGNYSNLSSYGTEMYYDADKKEDTSHWESKKNPYVQAFWKWWPDLRNCLQELRITGGEPTLSRNFWLLLESLASDPPKQTMSVCLNTNLNINKTLVDKLIYVSKRVATKNAR